MNSIHLACIQLFKIVEHASLIPHVFLEIGNLMNELLIFIFNMRHHFLGHFDIILDRFFGRILVEEHIRGFHGFGVSSLCVFHYCVKTNRRDRGVVVPKPCVGGFIQDVRIIVASVSVALVDDHRIKVIIIFIFGLSFAQRLRHNLTRLFLLHLQQLILKRRLLLHLLNLHLQIFLKLIKI